MDAYKAIWYPVVYQRKPYAAEAEQLHKLISLHGAPSNTLLDIACGTGGHLEFLARWYQCFGNDISQAMVEVASARLPEVTFGTGDMSQLSLEQTFGVVVCMFGSTSHLLTIEELYSACARMAEHTQPDGVVLVEPWILWGRPHSLRGRLLQGSSLDGTVARMSRSTVSATNERHVKVVLDYMIDDRRAPQVTHTTTTFTLARYSEFEFKATLRAAGLTVTYIEPSELFPMGLFLGKK